MNRHLLILPVLLLTATAAMAQTAAAPAAAKTDAAAKPAAVVAAKPADAAVAAKPADAVVPAQPAATTFTGKIQSVSLADATKGVSAQITATDDAGKAQVFTVKDGTTIYNEKSEAIGLDKLKAADKVSVKYTTSGTTQEAVSVRIVA